jgi:hypothetical protein
LLMSFLVNRLSCSTVSVVTPLLANKVPTLVYQYPLTFYQIFFNFKCLAMILSTLSWLLPLGFTTNYTSVKRLTYSVALSLSLILSYQ